MNCIPHEWLELIVVTQASTGTSSGYSIFFRGTTWLRFRWRSLSPILNRKLPCRHPPAAGDCTVEGRRVAKFFPRTRGYLGITAVPGGFMRSSIRGGPPDKREMDESMARMVAVAGGTKYSEYPALSRVTGVHGARKIFSGRVETWMEMQPSLRGPSPQHLPEAGP
jgi:hypothetical protein